MMSFEVSIIMRRAIDQYVIPTLFQIGSINKDRINLTSSLSYFTTHPFPKSSSQKKQPAGRVLDEQLRNNLKSSPALF